MNKDDLLEAFESLITGVKYTPKYYIHEIRKIIEQHFSILELLNALIKTWDEKRKELLCFRKDGLISGGIEQSKIIEHVIRDLRSLRALGEKE